MAICGRLSAGVRSYSPLCLLTALAALGVWAAPASSQDGADYIVKMRVVTFYELEEGDRPRPWFLERAIYKDAQKQPDGYNRVPPPNEADGASSDFEVQAQLHELDRRFLFRVVASASARAKYGANVRLVAQSGDLYDLASQPMRLTVEFAGSFSKADGDGWTLFTLHQWEARTGVGKRSRRMAPNWLKVGGTYRWFTSGRGFVLLTILAAGQYE